MTHACNCMYGTNDPRCCVNRARREELLDAWQRGREGKPLDLESLSPDLRTWAGIALQPATFRPCGGECTTCVEPYHGKATTNS